MASLGGKIEPMGPFLYVKAVLTNQHALALKAANRPIPQPVSLWTLVDTGASISALDSTVIRSLGLIQTGKTPIHTPIGYEERDIFGVTFFLGSAPGQTRAFTVGAVIADLAGEGFLAIIGWDILCDCVLTCDGPNRAFRLEY